MRAAPAFPSAPGASVQAKPGPAGLLRMGHVLQAAQATRHSARQAAPGYFHQIVSGIAPQTIDKHGNQYWNGWRTTLSWTVGTTGHMAATKGWGCAIGSFICTGAANGIDHIVDFATVQAGLATQTYCDGTHHWNGVPMADARAAYNDTTNLRWSCTSCNSSKSGAKGLYSPPAYAGACPGMGCLL